MTPTESKEQPRQPSKQLLDAIADLRKFDEDFSFAFNDNSIIILDRQY
jgi:hypothetical protein